MRTLMQEIARIGITYRAKYEGKADDDVRDGGPSWPHHRWSVRFGLGRRSFTTMFKTGMGHDPNVPPPPDHVMSCLISDATVGRQGFEDFCSELGYDSDSRRAEATWRACQATAKRLDSFLGEFRSDLEAAEQP